MDPSGAIDGKKIRLVEHHVHRVARCAYGRCRVGARLQLGTGGTHLLAAHQGRRAGQVQRQTDDAHTFEREKRFDGSGFGGRGLGGHGLIHYKIVSASRPIHEG